MIFPEWTTPNIIFHAFCAVMAVFMGISEYFSLFVLQYSKFRPKNGMNPRLGMFLIYFPATIVPLIFAAPYFRHMTLVQGIVLAMPVLHFLKRSLESLFLHKYSGPIDLFSVIVISGFYSLISGSIAYFNGISFAAFDALFVVGVVLYLVGEIGNFIHHAILVKLRGNTNEYIIPSGGLFDQVVCAHYFFEIIAWIGVIFASRHLIALITVVGMSEYLFARSIKTLHWYRQRFENFPKERKALIPFVF